jgi:hypothetical protein
VLTFQLVVSNGFASSSIASTTVTVNGAKIPVVNAGADQSVAGGTQVHLTGSASDPNGASGQPLKYAWSQTAGAAVTFDNAASATPTFTAPAMTPGQAALTLTFRLTVTNAMGLSGSAGTNVTLKPMADSVTITAATYRLSGSRLAVNATSSVTNGAPVLTLHVPGKADAVMTYDPTRLSYSVPQYIVNPMPSSVSVTSSFGGSATSPITRLN